MMSSGLKADLKVKAVLVEVVPAAVVRVVDRQAVPVADVAIKRADKTGRPVAVEAKVDRAALVAEAPVVAEGKVAKGAVPVRRVADKVDPAAEANVVPADRAAPAGLHRGLTRSACCNTLSSLTRTKTASLVRTNCKSSSPTSSSSTPARAVPADLEAVGRAVVGRAVVGRAVAPAAVVDREAVLAAHRMVPVAAVAPAMAANGPSGLVGRSDESCVTRGVRAIFPGRSHSFFSSVRQAIS